MFFVLLLLACGYVADKIRNCCRKDDEMEKVTPIDQRPCALKGEKNKASLYNEGGQSNVNRLTREVGSSNPADIICQYSIFHVISYITKTSIYISIQFGFLLYIRVIFPWLCKLREFLIVYNLHISTCISCKTSAAVNGRSVSMEFSSFAQARWFKREGKNKIG